MKFMRRWMMVALLAVAAGGARAGDQDFTLVNQTGVEINQVFVSPSAKNDWEEDILGEDTLPDGESVDIEFETEEEAELWDIKVTDEDDNAIVWTRINLLKVSKVTLLWDAENKKATAKTE